MKAVILAGGLGTRLSEETERIPKPLVEIGGMPILWHIMKMYGVHGITDFIICCGYKGVLIKKFFADYLLNSADVSFDLAANRMSVINHTSEPWHVTLADTGEDTMTGGRLQRIAPYLAGEDTFCMTYGDGVSDLDIAATVAFHRDHGRRATVTAVRPPGRFGALELSGEAVTRLIEKPKGDGQWINGGFFVLSTAVLDAIAGDTTPWEMEPMATLAAAGELMVYRHDGFWQSMDTLRERNLLRELWARGEAPWKTW
jgi:glucose-1-phosphate cytidylyltransferase